MVQVGTPTVDGQMSRLDAQRLFIETLARDGKVLVRYVQTEKNTDGFQIEFVEADVLDEELSEKNIRVGVE